MADGVAITAGSGTTIATDDVSSAHYQRVKLIHGADGTNDGDVSLTNPYPVRTMIQRVPVTIAGLTNATYAAGEQMGTIITFASMARTSGGGGLIVGATLVDSDNVCGPIDLILFDSSVTLTAGDNAAFSVSDADAAKMIGVIPLAGPTAIALNRSLQAFNIAVPYICSGGTSLYGSLIARSANTAQPTSTAYTITLYFQN